VEQCDLNLEFCEAPVDTCTAIDGIPGSCVRVPESCNNISFLPVCGCNGITYDNDCERQRARIAKAIDGSCPETCGGPSPQSFCIDSVFYSVFCDIGSGHCEYPSNATGKCVPLPQDCIGVVVEPVCGCNNQTYSNDCERQNNAAIKARDGEC